MSDDTIANNLSENKMQAETISTSDKIPLSNPLSAAAAHETLVRLQMNCMVDDI